MPKHVLIALSAGSLSALVSLAFLSGSPGALMFVYFAPLPLFMVGLSLGVTAGTVASATGLVLAGLVGGVVAAGLYGLVHALPAWLTIRQSLLQRPQPGGGAAWYPAGFVLSGLAALGAALLVASGLVIWSMGDTIVLTVSTHLDRVFAALLPTLPMAERDVLVASLIPYFPGAVGSSWVVMAALNGLLAQAILVRMGRNLRPSPSLSGLVLPDWLSWLLVGAAVLALLGPGETEYTGRNLTMILGVPFFFLGLAVFHAVAKRQRLPHPGAFVVMLCIISLLFVWIALLVTGVGMIEQWAGLRRRFAGPGSGGEME